jgi:Phosphatidylserine/phosphatidylglycerophosphate/cardiolipin synthases and related enzymes
MMKSKGILVTVIIIGLLTVCIPFDLSDGADNDALLLYEVSPRGAEGFSLYNYGTGTVDLKDYSVTDGEGTLTFTGITVEPQSRVTIVNRIDPDTYFTNRDRTYVLNSDKVIQTKSFALNDNGDDIYLFKGNTLVDAFCYGNKTADTGWSGPPVAISSSKYFLRVAPIDTNTASDWILTQPGLTNFSFDPSLSYDAVVTPFTFPESNGGPIYKALENARSEILISIYQLTSPNLVALLCDLEKRTVGHIDVRILLEGDVFGYDMSTELTLMKSITDAGGEVLLINSQASGNYERYAFVHNKYAIIDSEKVIITSENWTTANMGTSKANRGWGAVIESTEYASFMTNVFNNDTKQEYGDVWALNEFYPSLKPYSGNLTYSPVPSYDTVSFNAKVTPLLSPDNSYVSQKYYMDNAKYRIFSEQLDFGSFSSLNNSSPVSWMSEASERGVDSRFILDASMSGSKEENASQISLINATTGIKAVTINGGPGFSTTHNKGIIIDDTVWLGSVNWTGNSFSNNRETAVLIDSPEVTEYFMEYFMEDWNANYKFDYEGALSVISNKDRITEEGYVTFTISGPMDESYTWDVYGNGDLRHSQTNRIVCENLIPGTYTMKITRDGTSESIEFVYTVHRSGSDTDPAPDKMEIPETAIFGGVIAAILAIIALVFKRKNH